MILYNLINYFDQQKKSISKKNSVWYNQKRINKVNNYNLHIH